MKSVSRTRLGTAALLVAVWSPSVTAETVVYKYDALGRLVAVETSSGPAPSKKTITYDPAGNRKVYSVAGATGGAGGGGGSGADGGGGAAVPPVQKLYVVVPLNGFTIIPIS